MIQPPDDGLKECRYGQEWRQVGMMTANMLPCFCNFFNMYMHRQTLTRIGPDSEDELRIFRCKNWPTVACPLEMQAQRLIGSNGNYYVVKKEMHRNCKWEEGKIRNGGNAENSGANALNKRRKSNVVNINGDGESTTNLPVPNHPLKQRNGGDEVVRIVSTRKSLELRPKQQANRSIKNVGSSYLALQATPKLGTRCSTRRQQAMEEERETTTDDDEEEGSAEDGASQDKQLLPLPNNADRHAQFVKIAKELGLNCNSLLGDTFFCASGNAALNLTLGVNDRLHAVQIIGSAGIRVLDVQQRMAGKMHWVWSLGGDWPQFLWALRGLTYLFFSTTTQQRQEESGQCVVQEPSEEHPENANASTEFSITETIAIVRIIGYLEAAVKFQREIGGFSISRKKGGLQKKSSAKLKTNKVTFLKDRGSVRVMEIARGKVESDERWREIGHEQFCYAVLGKCTAAFLAKEMLNNDIADTPSTSGSK